MGHFESDHSDSNAFTRDRLFYGTGYCLCKHTYRGKDIVVQVKNIVHFFLRNDQGVAHHERYDVQESNELPVLSNDVARDLPIDDFGKNGRHTWFFTFQY